MFCPFCGSCETAVETERVYQDGEIHKRLTCINCFNTVQIRYNDNDIKLEKIPVRRDD